jgi:hypothetical protein
MKDGLRLTGILIILMLVLKTQGCLPEPGDYGDFDEPSEEHRMNEVERKLEMLENNQNY